jgi:hypothetical protein
LQYHMNECCFAAHPESLPISHEPALLTLKLGFD